MHCLRKCPKRTSSEFGLGRLTLIWYRFWPVAHSGLEFLRHTSDQRTGVTDQEQMSAGKHPLMETGTGLTAPRLQAAARHKLVLFAAESRDRARQWIVRQVMVSLVQFDI